MINRNTTMAEVAAIVSGALEDAKITATLSGGAAVTIYSDNAYQSADLDFVSSERNKVIEKVINDIGFRQSGGSRMFEHPESDWYIEFPPGPLGFGDTYVDAQKLPKLDTVYGQIRIITPTLCVIDRLAAYWYHMDRQTWDQAIEVAKRQEIDWGYVYSWAKSERQSKSDIDRLRSQSDE
ncbi:hypothetical protein N9383_05755 [Granulosicoccus sp.]|nr:hypothetical protein [Granulosicoccus sp.]